MAKKILTLNIGASSISLAEYQAGAKGDLTLVKYGTEKLGAPLDSGNVDTILVPALMNIVREKGIRPGKVAISVSGQMVFPRFAAIPPSGDQERFEQLIRYEIEQNIPFPMDEMVCDRQVLGDTDSGDKSVMIVAAKSEQIEAITDAVQSAGFEPVLVDVAPLAVTNLYKASCEDGEACVVILDIGAKTTSLIISEGTRLYNRSIPVAGNTITNEIAKSLGCTTEDAEQLKLESGYVSLGGVMEDEDASRDRISKVCRAVMTRLHAEISRSINFYRSQQGGSAPVRMYLTGGSSILPQTDAFFADSLGIEVVYMNPFDLVGIGSGVDQEMLNTDAAVLSASAGVALHAAGNSFLAIDLLPSSIIEARAEVAKIPFVAASAAMIVCALGAALFVNMHLNAVTDAALEAVEQKTTALGGIESQIKKATEKKVAALADAEELKKLLDKRSSTVARLNAVSEALGDSLWIDKWEPEKDGAVNITVRGWKDSTKIIRDGANDEYKGKTVPEIIEAKLKNSGVVKEGKVSIANMAQLGKKKTSLDQFVVRVEFK